MKCRHCQTVLGNCFVDLGSAPPSNAYLTPEQMAEPEVWYPLKVMVCEQCWLVQTEDFAGRDELFDANYAYFSSFSSTWIAHAERYVEEMIARFSLNNESHVIEVAANDGYLLQFMKTRNILCTGIEPTHSTAMAAREKGIDIVEDFFGVHLAKELLAQAKQADLITANNVLAHVPDINDFISGFTVLLKHHGIATFEFPHLFNLVKQNQFDTIYHEHFSYLSFTAVTHVFEANGLTIFDVEELSLTEAVYVYLLSEVTQASIFVLPVLNNCWKWKSEQECVPSIITLIFKIRQKWSKMDYLLFYSKQNARGKGSQLMERLQKGTHC